MRAALVLLLLLFLLLLPSCDAAAARVVVDGVSAERLPDGTVRADFDVTGVEQTGGDVGRYCVSVHWLDPSVDLGILSAQPTYFGELDHVQSCTSGLADGDKRSFHLFSTRRDLPVAAGLRAQAGIGDAIETKDISSP